ncbi:hypothetical protein HYU22_04995, partial [Candidatus Woesearchaeota archaeon]|nr:hypothetical protein [Candidatus Woesearchaeota archaeon]
MKQPRPNGLTFLLVFAIAFMLALPAVLAVDSDGDGVPDNKDICPGFNDSIDVDGDGIPNGCDINNGDGPRGDMDGDGILNQNDYCPTERGIAAYHGCLGNYAPTIDAVPLQLVQEGEWVQFTIQARDRNRDPITLSLESAPASAVLQNYGEGRATFRWGPSFEDAGDYFIIVTASDGELQTSATITMTVVNVNRAPQLKEIETPFEAHPGEELGFIIEAHDPEQDSITIMAENLPAPMIFVDRHDGFAVGKWTPTDADLGPHQFQVTASDGLLEDTMTVTINVVIPPAEEAGDNDNGAGEEDPAGDENPAGNDANNQDNPEISAEEQRYQELRDTYDQLRDDYSASKRKYDRAVAENNQRDISRYADELDNTDGDLSNLDDDVDTLQDDVEENDELADREQLLDDIDTLKEDIQNLRDRIESLLESPAEPAPSQIRPVTAPPRDALPQIRVEPLSFPAEAPTVEESVNSWQTIRPLAWMGAGSIVLLAIIIFLAA